MILRGIDFGQVMNASGARGFFGEGYWFHKPAGVSYRGSTFVAKTVIIERRDGNMPLCEDGITPRDWFPDCIKVNLWQGLTLNAVGLSNNGARFYFELGRWQKMKRPFFISFMAVGATREERIREFLEFIKLFKTHLPSFEATVGLEINATCPNTEIDAEELISEVSEYLDIASELGIPLVAKINLLYTVEAGLAISAHPACDAICQGNTVPWLKLFEQEKWSKFFGSKTSPLQKYGGGGLGGRPLFPYVIKWNKRVRELGMKKPLIHCAGILSPIDAMVAFKFGRADAIQLGSVSIVRPWRVPKIIRFANEYKNREKA